MRLLFLFIRVSMFISQYGDVFSFVIFVGFSSLSYLSFADFGHWLLLLCCIATTILNMFSLAGFISIGNNQILVTLKSVCWIWAHVSENQKRRNSTQYLKTCCAYSVGRLFFVFFFVFPAAEQILRRLNLQVRSFHWRL